MVYADFLLMNCTGPYNALLGQEWISAMEVVSSSFYQCIKFPFCERIVKVRSDQWASHKCSEAAFDEVQECQVQGRTIMNTE